MVLVNMGLTLLKLLVQQIPVVERAKYIGYTVISYKAEPSHPRIKEFGVDLVLKQTGIML